MIFVISFYCSTTYVQQCRSQLGHRHHWRFLQYRLKTDFLLDLIDIPRLNSFARSWFWWLRQSHSVNYANHQHSPFARRRHDIRQAATRRCKLHFSRYRLVKVSWKSVQPFPRTVVSYFSWTEKKTKKNKKTYVKHIRYRLIGGYVNKTVQWPALQNAYRVGQKSKPT